MDIFVQSRGHSPDFEYCWQPRIPPHLATISRWIQSESVSVVLSRLDEKLILLATGLYSPEKKDFRDRPIRHSIAWVLDDNRDNEIQIKAIAIQALQGSLISYLDQYIKFGGENGFDASILDIKKISRSFSNREAMKALPSSELSCKIGKNSQVLRDDLVCKLQQYNLPKPCEFIIIATGVKSEDSLEKARAWRSLSNLVKSEDWRKLSGSEVQQGKKAYAAIAIMIVIVAVLVLIILLRPHALNSEITLPPPQEMPPN